MHTGTVKWFSDAKGYGWITPDSPVEGVTEERPDLFVHYSGITGAGYKSLRDGQRVRFTAEDLGKGPKAVEVSPLESVSV